MLQRRAWLLAATALLTFALAARPVAKIMPELEAEGIQFVHLSALLPKPITAALRLR